VPALFLLAAGKAEPRGRKIDLEKVRLFRKSVQF
jgi:hypothetical protein